MLEPRRKLRRSRRASSFFKISSFIDLNINGLAARAGKCLSSPRRSPEGEGGSSADELVPGAVDGEDVLGFVGRSLDLLPQLRHEVVDGPRGRRFFVAPDLVENLLAGHDLAGVRDEVAQEIELARGEVDPLAGAVRLAGP